MKQNRPSRWLRVVFTAAVVSVIALPAAAQQEDVKPRVVTHRAAAGQAAVDPLAEWESEYAKALEAVEQLAASSRTGDMGRQLALDLAAFDEALREYVRVSERLRHKDRALQATVDSLDLSNEMQARTFQTLSNALKTAHDAQMSSIRNLK